MESLIELQKERERTEKELKELQGKLDAHRDHLYSELAKLNKEKADVERRRKHLELYEGYFRKQEQRLLVVGVVATLFLVMGFAYVELGTAQFGNLLWLSTAGVLGLFLLINLTMYLLDRLGVKEQVASLFLRVLIHIVKLPFYLLKAIWKLIKSVFSLVMSRQSIKTNRASRVTRKFRSKYTNSNDDIYEDNNII